MMMLITMMIKRFLEIVDQISMLDLFSSQDVFVKFIKVSLDIKPD